MNNPNLQKLQSDLANANDRYAYKIIERNLLDSSIAHHTTETIKQLKEINHSSNFFLKKVNDSRRDLLHDIAYWTKEIDRLKTEISNPNTSLQSIQVRSKRLFTSLPNGTFFRSRLPGGHLSGNRMKIDNETYIYVESMKIVKNGPGHCPGRDQYHCIITDTHGYTIEE